MHLEARPINGASRPRYLIALENPDINKLNASSDYCQGFDLAFAWDVRLFHLPNVVPILIPHPLGGADSPTLENRDIFSCLINANKAFKEVLPSDLYLERINTIRWYERHAPDKFELYGLGWGKSTPAFTTSARITRSISRLKTRFFGIPPFPSFRGELNNKADVLRHARFSYCYENSRDLSNYLTEKIFDSLVNGCVPIYWGADNVLEHIPAECFIDRRKFIDTAAIHRHLLSISPDEYAAYQRNMLHFLGSDAAAAFSAGHFANLVAERVCQDLQAQGIEQL
ncbi:MAG: glycosyltransferase family 10 [Rhodoferax sp.]|nr:glycosyltransferase family 10 [Rhodoferax sp.]